MAEPSEMPCPRCDTKISRDQDIIPFPCPRCGLVLRMVIPIVGPPLGGQFYWYWVEVDAE